MRDDIYWIGGGTCAGKSTSADVIALRHGLTAYHSDADWDDHVKRADPSHHPNLHKVGGMSPSEWFLRPVSTGIAEELASFQEEIRLVLEDLEGLDSRRSVVADGTLLLPGNLASLGIPKKRAIWLIPTPEFQRRAYRHRGEWVDDLLRKYADSEQAWGRWMERDAVVAEYIRTSASDLGYSWIEVDGSEPIDKVAGRVEEHFGLV